MSIFTVSHTEPKHVFLTSLYAFPGNSDGKVSTCNAGDLGSIPALGRSPGEGWQPTPVLLPGKSYGWRNLVDYNPQGHKGSAMTERLHFTFKQKGPTVQHRELYSTSCDKPE